MIEKKNGKKFYYGHCFDLPDTYEIKLINEKFGVHIGFSVYIRLIDYLGKNENIVDISNKKLLYVLAKEWELTEDQLLKMIEYFIELDLVLENNKLIQSVLLIDHFNKVHKTSETNRNNRLGKTKNKDEIEQEQGTELTEPKSQNTLFNEKDNTEKKTLREINDYLETFVGPDIKLYELEQWISKHGELKVKELLDSIPVVHKALLNKNPDHNDSKTIPYLKKVLNNDGVLPDWITGVNKEAQKELSENQRRNYINEWQIKFNEMDLGNFGYRPEEGFIHIAKTILNTINYPDHLGYKRQFNNIIKTLDSKTITELVNEAFFTNTTDWNLYRQSDEYFKDLNFKKEFTNICNFLEVLNVG